MIGSLGYRSAEKTIAVSSTRYHPALAAVTQNALAHESLLQLAAVRRACLMRKFASPVLRDRIDAAIVSTMGHRSVEDSVTESGSLIDASQAHRSGERAALDERSGGRSPFRESRFLHGALSARAPQHRVDRFAHGVCV